MDTISLEWEDGAIPIPIPDNSELVHLVPTFPPPLGSLELERIVSADVLLLADSIKAARQITIIVEDSSRSTITGPFVALLIRKIRTLRRQNDHPALIIAAGAHFHKPSNEDLIKKIGSDNPLFFLHDATDVGQLVRIGESVSGIPFFLNRRVVRSDLRLVIGTVNIHPFAGFSGGAKILLPGVAGLETIEAFHNLPPGNPGLLECPMRHLMNEVLAMMPIHFSWQFLSRPDGAIFGIHRGPLVKAHSLALEAVKKIMAVQKPSKPVDFIVAGSRPFQQNLLGSFKALAQLTKIINPGSKLLLFNEALQGRGEHSWRNQPQIVKKHKQHYEEIFRGTEVTLYSPRSNNHDFEELFPGGFRLLKTYPDLTGYLKSFQPHIVAVVPYAPLTLLS